MMDGRRGGRQTLLPLRSIRQLSNTVSCWYCDFKFMAFNEPLFRFGRRHSRYLRVWFSMGIGFSLAAVFGVTMLILYQLAKAYLVYAGGNALSGTSLFGLPFLTTGMNISLSSLGYLCISSVICIIVHEFGHALAAASEGVQMEYIAFFYALVFPGALVAFNHTLLQALPSVASLRIYCAGIWHNAAFCGVCTVVLSLLPIILSPFFMHGENPMVLDVHPLSPLSGYLSANDVILSLDEFHIHTAEEWKQIITVLTEKTQLLTSGQSTEIANVQKSYCVPDSVIEKSIQIQFEGYQTNCPNELIAFVPATCLDVSKYNVGGKKFNHEKIEVIHCLNAKDVVKHKKCAYNSVQTHRNSSACLCSEEESCLTPLQLPGLGWVEITYSSLECLNRGRIFSSDNKHTGYTEGRCLQTFVFVGDLMSMSHSIHLTSYRPRLSIYFISHLPDLLEKLFTCAFHVSMILALLNSLPVFFLDGESILEVILLHYLGGFLSPRMKRSVLRCCLLLGTFISTHFILHIIFLSLS
ncbi:hypothetical protein ACS0TY_019519 [Phlomoides rotata]